MRRMVLVTVVVAMTASACSDGAGSTTSTSTSIATTTTLTTTTITTTTEPDLSCPDPIVVTSTAELVAALDGLEWYSAGPYASGNLAVTTDLAVEGTITLSGADIAPPEWCEDDCEDVAVSWPDGLDGVTGQGERGTRDAVVTLTDATVRLRPYLLDYHPLPVTWGPIVSVLPACATPCPDGQTMCPRDGVCYSPERFCTECEERTRAECACRGPDGPAPDGGLCQVFISNDQIVVGTCRNGVCEIP